VTAELQTALEAPANSPKNSFTPLDLAQLVISVILCDPIVDETQVELVPEESESKYWWTS